MNALYGLFGLAVAAKAMIAAKEALLGENESDEDNTYFVTYECMNCGQLECAHIPKGYTISEWAEENDIVCDNCHTSGRFSRYTNAVGD